MNRASESRVAAASCVDLESLNLRCSKVKQGTLKCTFADSVLTRSLVSGLLPVCHNIPTNICPVLEHGGNEPY